MIVCLQMLIESAAKRSHAETAKHELTQIHADSRDTAGYCRV